MSKLFDFPVGFCVYLPPYMRQWIAGWLLLDIGWFVLFLEIELMVCGLAKSLLSPPFAKAGDIKTHSSVHPSVCLSVCLSVTKTLTWFISSEILMMEHWYLACMILVTSPFNLHHALTLTYFKVKVVAGRGTTILRICLLQQPWNIYWATKETSRLYIPILSENKISEIHFVIIYTLQPVIVVFSIII